MSSRNIVALDVGEKRIGVAVADTSIRIAVPYETIQVDGEEVRRIAEIVSLEDANILVVGYPRNQQGEATAQTAYVERFTNSLVGIATIVFQDESLTSVLAEQQLKATRKNYQKGDIDMTAAALILQDYLERR